MNVSTRDLEAFLALADLHSFTRAAARCHLSQSAFSTRIASLEDALGARLFDRTTRSVELTQAGELFLESARRLHGDFREVVTDFRDHTSRRKGRVAVAALPSTASAWLPAVFARFHADNPGIKLTLHDVVSDACLALVRDGTVDFAIASRPPAGEDMEAHLLSEDRFCLVCHESHPLAAKATLKIRDLAPHGFIHLTRDSSVRQHLETAFHPMQMNTVLQLDHLATVAGMVQAGLGITVVPELTLFQFTRPGLVVRPLRIAGLFRSIYVVRRRGKSLSFAAAALYDRVMSERGRIHDFLRMQLDWPPATAQVATPLRVVRKKAAAPNP
ncbi:MAG: LysR family transcriptional regulator [Burkholderiaceae bacterium]|nr:LysR family transcriptional regulator [Burkholderiaceae bacterium]